MVGYKHAEMALWNQLKMKLNHTVHGNIPKKCANLVTTCANLKQVANHLHIGVVTT